MTSGFVMPLREVIGSVYQKICHMDARNDHSSKAVAAPACSNPTNVRFILKIWLPTVDGLEIRRAPVDMVNIPSFTTGFIHPRW